MKTSIRTLLIALSLLAGVIHAHAQGTAFTYQGRLNHGVNPANGTYDLRFIIYDLAGGGAAQAGPLTNSATGVSNGLFTVTLNFGAGVFNGPNRWIEIGVRTNGGGAFTTLTPRQAITATPYASIAGNLSGPLSATQLTGTLPNAQLSASVSLLGAGIESAEITDGTITTGDLNAGVLNGTFWKLGGNTGANPTNGIFLGTADNLPLEIKINGQRALRIEPATNSTHGYSPNILGGFSGNIVSNGLVGAVIGGGGGPSSANRVGGHYSTVVGGRGNTASGDLSTAMGFFTTASGPVSTAMGYSTSASGDYSTAMGKLAKANHDGSFVWADAQNTDFASTLNNQFSIRAANGLRIHNQGDTAPLLVFDTERSWAFRQLSAGASTALELGTVSSDNPKNFIIRGNFVGINVTDPTHVLHVNGVARSTQSSWATSSDARAKRDITTLEGSLERIARLRPVNFEYTPEYAAGRAGYEGRFTGFIAQEVESVFPEVVETVQEQIGASEVDDFRLLNAGGLTPHLVAAVQELARGMEAGSRNAEDRIRKLEADNAELKQRLEKLEQLLAVQLAGGVK
jgi:hypothetical protein